MAPARIASLVLFTPRRYSALPGLALPGVPEGRPTKDELADYLHTYANHFALPVQTDTRVVCMQQHAETFVLQTTHGTYQATTIIVATGPFHHPRIPVFASALSQEVQQLHSASYHNPSEISPGPVLVVGASDSGAHIAAELAHAHPVSLAAAHPLYFVPLTLLGKSLFWYLDHLRLLEVDGTTRLGAWLKAQPEPVLGLELKQALKDRRVQIKPRATGADGNAVQFADGSQAQVRTVIWATGYRQDFSWIRIPGALDEHGQPRGQKASELHSRALLSRFSPSSPRAGQHWWDGSAKMPDDSQPKNRCWVEEKGSGTETTGRWDYCLPHRSSLATVFCVGRRHPYCTTRTRK